MSLLQHGELSRDVSERPQNTSELPAIFKNGLATVQLCLQAEGRNCTLSGKAADVGRKTAPLDQESFRSSVACGRTAAVEPGCSLRNAAIHSSYGNR